MKYEYILDETPPEGNFWVTRMPTNTFIRRVRHFDEYSVVEFDKLVSGSVTGEVDVQYYRNGTTVRDHENSIYAAPVADKERTYDLSFPCALVIEWVDNSVIEYDGEEGDLIGFEHHEDEMGLKKNGIPTYNRYKEAKYVTLGSTGKHALHIGQGIFRGSAEQWITVPTGTPQLDFSYGCEDENYEDQRLTVHINGKEIWSGQCTSNTEWTDIDTIGLSSFAGEKVLLTFGAEWNEKHYYPTEDEKPGLFGDISLE